MKWMNEWMKVYWYRFDTVLLDGLRGRNRPAGWLRCTSKEQGWGGKMDTGEGALLVWPARRKRGSPGGRLLQMQRPRLMPLSGCQGWWAASATAWISHRSAQLHSGPEAAQTPRLHHVSFVETRLCDVHSLFETEAIDRADSLLEGLHGRAR